jgi:hypothetical protein
MTRHAWLLALCALAVSACQSNVPLPADGDVPPTAATPIDGDWIGYSTPFENAHLRLDRGRLIVADEYVTSVLRFPPGAVIARNFRQTGPVSFECEWAVPPHLGGSDWQFVPAPVQISTSRSLLIRVPTQTGGARSGYEYDGDKVLIRATGTQNAPHSGDGTPKVTLDKAVKREELQSEWAEIPPGGIFRSKRSRTIEHEVVLELDTALHGELSVDKLEFIKASIKGQLETKLGQTFKQTETVEKEISLDGNRAHKYKITWYGRFVTGHSKVGFDNANYVLPFKFLQEEEFSAVPIQ